MINQQAKQIALAVTMLVVPGSGIAFGSYLLYKSVKKIMDRRKDEKAKQEKEQFDFIKDEVNEGAD